MTAKSICESDKKDILKIIFRYISKEDCLVFLFGSFVKKQIYPSSDIDIGIICEKAVELEKLAGIKSNLEEIKLLRDIDVVDFSSNMNSTFLKSALKEIQIWHQTKKSKQFLSSLKRLTQDLKKP